MATDLDQQLTSYFQWVEHDLGLPMRRSPVEAPPTVRSALDVARSEVVREGPRKGPSRWYAVAAAASLVVVLVAAGIIAVTRPKTTKVVPSDTQPFVGASSTVSVGTSAETTVPPSTSDTTSTSGQVSGNGVQGESELIAASPLAGRIDPSAAWTGDRMVIWGGAALGGSGEVPLADGAAYDPVLRVWTPLPSAPISARSNAATVWTGSEMLVWGGSDNGNSLFDGAAYNPTTNTWRQLPTNTLAATVRPTVAWTGTEMIVLEGANGSPRGAAFNPVTNSWRPIANPPGRGAVPYPHAVWTGTEMVTTLSKGPGDSPIIAAYDPQDDTWEELPIDLGSGQRPNLVWTGTEVLAFGMTDVPGRAWNPATKTWRALAVAPPHRALGSQPVWTGHLAVFCNGGPTLSIYDPTADTWSTSPTEALSAERVDGAAVWTGTTLLAWGGFVSNPDGTAAGANDGVAWTQRQG